MLNRSLYIFASKMLGFGVRFLVPYFLVRILTKADFGSYRQFFLLEVLFATIFQMGINQGLYYFVPRDEKNAGAYFINSLGLNIAVFCLAFSGAYFVADELSVQLNMSILSDHFGMLALFTVLLMLSVANDCYLLALRRVKQAAVLDITGQVILTGGTILSAYLWQDLSLIFRTLVIGKLIHLVLGLWYTHFRVNGFHAQHYFLGLRGQVRYGIMLGIGGTLWTLLLRLHDLFVSRYYGPETYAVYSAGVIPVPILVIYMNSLAAVALGQFSLMEKEGDWEGIRELWKKIQVSMYGIALPVMLGLLIISKPIVLFLYTDAYAEAVTIFRINTLFNLNVLFNATLILRAMSRNDIIIRWHTIVLIAAPMMLWAGMSVAGPAGIISAHVVLTVVGRFILLVLLNKKSPGGLIYTPRPADVLEFYRQGFSKVGRWLNQLNA
jgi:teichuronic acid exporter